MDEDGDDFGNVSGGTMARMMVGMILGMMMVGLRCGGW